MAFKVCILKAILSAQTLLAFLVFVADVASFFSYAHCLRSVGAVHGLLGTLGRLGRNTVDQIFVRFTQGGHQAVLLPALALVFAAVHAIC